MKIQFKNKELTATKVVNSIVKFYHMSGPEDRFDWYGEANKIACEMGNPIITAGVIAALSPVKDWTQNIKCAWNAIEGRKIGHIKQFESKALAILALDEDATASDVLGILRGRKICSFYLNILFPEQKDEVTIDRHALSVALGHWITDEEYRGMTANQYKFFVNCYKRAAKKLEASPLLVQSATWVVFRKIKKQYK